jgi:hypothetical protein
MSVSKNAKAVVLKSQDSHDQKRRKSSRRSQKRGSQHLSLLFYYLYKHAKHATWFIIHSSTKIATIFQLNLNEIVVNFCYCALLWEIGQSRRPKDA